MKFTCPLRFVTGNSMVDLSPQALPLGTNTGCLGSKEPARMERD